MYKNVFFIAGRFLRTIHKEKTIKTMLTVCFVSITISTCALALIAAVMSGFERATHNKLQGIHSDITIQSLTKTPLNFEKIEQVLTQEFSDKIAHITPFSDQHAIIQKPGSNDISHIVMLQGIDPARDAQTRALAASLDTAPDGATRDERIEFFAQALAGDKILIGKSLARTLDVQVGDKINLLYTPSNTASSRSRKITFDQIELTVGGVFSIGIDEFDSAATFTSLSTLKKMFPDAGITHIGAKIALDANQEETVTQLQDRFNLDVFTWQELYPALIAALMLEKYAMVLILALVTLIASMNIIGLLFMYITQKRGSIAILKAMGMMTKTVRTIFACIGITITLTAGFLGLLFASGASWLLEEFQLIKLPEVYYSSYVPADMNWHILLAVATIIFVVSLSTTWFATRGIRSLSIAKTLKFES